MKQILIFGDSITYGAWDSDGGWVDRLRKHCHNVFLADQSKYTLIYNLGIPGENTREAVLRILAETEARLDPGTKASFILAYGANDSAFQLGEKEFRVSKDEFVANIKTIISQIKPWAERILILTITPVNEDITTKTDYRIRTNEFINLYNQEIKMIAASGNVELIDINNEYLKQGPLPLLSGDGLHPNTPGHQKIFETVKDFLK